MTARHTLDDAILKVVRAGNCSGCGACVQLDAGLTMALDDEGYSRPVRRTGTATAAGVPHFRRACPGVLVEAQRPEGSERHPILGPVVQAWEAWATDPAIRFEGSSGGTLTAISAWLVESGTVQRVLGAGADVGNPRRTVPVRITSREEALAASGSRYAPVSTAAVADALKAGSAVVGKPCESSALRALCNADAREQPPILLSFFCAGTPSQHATETLVRELGVPPEEKVKDLWYRGRGWPGRFTVTRDDGNSVSSSYDDSWGRHLGPTAQWRCKICPDGIGESADITAGDYWRATSDGYPAFEDGPGVSALIARTERGRDLILQAAEAGVLTLAPLDLDSLVAVQPLQRSRRVTLLGRLAGTLAAGGRVPRYRGFSLTALALPRLRAVYRTAKGTYRRRRASGVSR